MPIINLTLSTKVDPARASQIAATLTNITARDLKKDPKVTAVAISSVEPTHWFAGGSSVADQARATFWLDIKVVDGTNTKAEMATYLAAVWQAMGEFLGPLHEESYVLVHEVPAAAYGFGGKSQEQRFIAGRLGVAA